MKSSVRDFLGKYVSLNILKTLDLTKVKVGLAIIDEVNGFVTPGMGALAPPSYDKVIDMMVKRTNFLARLFEKKGLPILVLNECHVPGILEPPYLAHCEDGTGEEKLAEELAWLYESPTVKIVCKNCINGFVGAINADGSNAVVDWINENQIEVILVVGICTDICVMQFVQTMLSARNKRTDGTTKMMPSLEEVAVLVGACSTYDLPLEVTKAIGIPESAAHPRELTNFMNLYFMQGSGAILTEDVAV